MLSLKIESQLHKNLVSELEGVFRAKGYVISAIDNGDGNKPNPVKNDGTVGDGENKVPDIEAEFNGRIIRGEAKCGNGDIESEHSITQYQLFSNLNRGGIASWLYIIVPQGYKDLADSVLAENLSSKQRQNVAVWESDSY